MAVNKDNHSKRLNMPLPDESNFLQDDCGRIRDSLNILDQNVATLDSLGKIPVDQFPDKVVQYTSADLLPEDRLPPSVVLVDTTGKVPASQLPPAGLTNVRDVSSEAAMLALVATPGDVANRLDIGEKYILAAADATKLDSWRIMPQTAVTSVNGETGALTGYPKLKPIANSIAMALDGVTGPLRLNADATDPYDAVTLKQLQTVQSVGAGGANMSGVMNNFIGAVEWFNGDRLSIPPGYIAADGQLESRTDPKTADLWTAIEKKVFPGITDAVWSTGIAGRGNYSLGDGATTFRVPDLNGIQRQGVNGFTGIDSLAGLFLRGDGNSASNGSTGSVRDNAAPNIYGVLRHNYSDTTAIWDGGDGPFTIGAPQVNQLKSFGSATDQVNGARPSLLIFNANLAHKAYGRDNAQEVRPNSVVGIWIIRANGAFQAANTSYQILNSDKTEPANGTIVKSGMLGCYYRINEKTRHFTNLQSSYTWGNSYASSMLGVGINDISGTMTAGTQFEFRSNGDLLVPSGIYGTVLRAEYKRNGIRNTVGGTVQSRIVNQVDNGERSAFGMFTSVGDTTAELRYGNLALTADGKTSKTWTFDMAGAFSSPGPIKAGGSFTAATNGGTVALATGIYPDYIEIQILSGAAGLPIGARAVSHNPSDARKKTNVKPIPAGKALADMAMVRPVSFSFKANALCESHPELPRSYGVIAQELEQIVPDAVITLSDGMKELDMTVINGFMLATIKDLMAQVNAQGEQIAKLEAKLGS